MVYHPASYEKLYIVYILVYMLLLSQQMSFTIVWDSDASRDGIYTRNIGNEAISAW